MKTFARLRLKGSLFNRTDHTHCFEPISSPLTNVHSTLGPESRRCEQSIVFPHRLSLPLPPFITGFAFPQGKSQSWRGDEMNYICPTHDILTIRHCFAYCKLHVAIGIAIQSEQYAIGYRRTRACSCVFMIPITRFLLLYICNLFQ
jgi:hypothetical protein